MIKIGNERSHHARLNRMKRQTCNRRTHTIYITEAVVCTSRHLLACKNTLNGEREGGDLEGERDMRQETSDKRYETRDISHVRVSEFHDHRGLQEKTVEKYACMCVLASRTAGIVSVLNAAWQCSQVAECGA